MQWTHLIGSLLSVWSWCRSTKRPLKTVLDFLGHEQKAELCLVHQSIWWRWSCRPLECQLHPLPAPDLGVHSNLCCGSPDSVSFPTGQVGHGRVVLEHVGTHGDCGEPRTSSTVSGISTQSFAFNTHCFSVHVGYHGKAELWLLCPLTLLEHLSHPAPLHQNILKQSCSPTCQIFLTIALDLCHWLPVLSPTSYHLFLLSCWAWHKIHQSEWLLINLPIALCS